MKYRFDNNSDFTINVKDGIRYIETSSALIPVENEEKNIEFNKVKQLISRYVPYDTTVVCERTGEEMILKYEHLNMCSEMMIKLKPMYMLSYFDMKNIEKKAMENVTVIYENMNEIYITNAIIEYLIKEHYDIFNLKELGFAYY